MVITFCRNKCCPVVEVVGDKIQLGDANGPEGVSVWTKENFNDFVDAVKEGKFDHIVEQKSNPLCPCGVPHSECNAGFC